MDLFSSAADVYCEALPKSLAHEHLGLAPSKDGLRELIVLFRDLEVKRMQGHPNLLVRPADGTSCPEV